MSERPPCPTCGGDGFIDGVGDCPDCSDGRVPLERMVRLWEMAWRYDLTGAVINGKTDDYIEGWRNCIAYLRGIR